MYETQGETKLRPTDQVEREAQESPFADLTLTDVVFPLVSIAVLLLLTFFIYIPYGFEIPVIIQETKDISVTYEKRAKKIDQIDVVSLDELDSISDTLDTKLPADVDVSTLASLVEDAASQNGLSKNKITLTDEPAVGFDREIDSSGKVKGLKSVDGTFSFTGSFSGIVDFLTELKEMDKLIVVDSLDVNAVQLDGFFTLQRWNVDVRLKGYGFEPYTEVTFDEPILPLPTVEDVENL